jgi:hypothetical protein
MRLVDVETTYSVMPALGCIVNVVEPGNAPSYQWAIDEAGVRVGHEKVEARTWFEPLQTADAFAGSFPRRPERSASP